jgi:hypothetical protein
MKPWQVVYTARLQCFILLSQKTLRILVTHAAYIFIPRTGYYEENTYSTALLFYAYFIDTIPNSECLAIECGGVVAGEGRGGSIPIQTRGPIIYSQKLFLLFSYTYVYIECVVQFVQQTSISPYCKQYTVV